MNSIPEGEGRWSIPEDMYVVLRREEYADFTFQMPTRTIAPFTVARPQLGRPLSSSLSRFDLPLRFWVILSE